MDCSGFLLVIPFFGAKSLYIVLCWSFALVLDAKILIAVFLRLSILDLFFPVSLKRCVGASILTLYPIGIVFRIINPS